MKKIIEKIYEQGYRNIDKDCVVLSIDELDEFRKDQAEVKFLKNKIIEQARKETAEKLFKELRSKCMLHTEYDWCDYLEIELDDFNQLAKQFGVEIN